MSGATCLYIFKIFQKSCPPYHAQSLCFMHYSHSSYAKNTKVKGKSKAREKNAE